MNNIPIQATSAEVSVPKRQRSQKSDTDGGEFRDMLTTALKPGGDATEKAGEQSSEKVDAVDGKNRTKASRKQEAAEIPTAEVAAAQVTQPDQPAETGAEVTEVGEEQVAAVVQPIVTGRMIEAQQAVVQAVVQTEAQSATTEQMEPVEAEAIPTQAQEQPVQTSEPAPPDRALPIDAPVSAEEPKTATVDGEVRHTRKVQHAPRAQHVHTDRQTREEPAISEDAAEDIVSARVVTRAAETAPVEQTRPVIRPDEAEGRRFSEMLTRASRELVQGKGVRETAETRETPVIEGADAPRELPRTETLVGIETESETDREPNAETEATAPKLKQVPTKAIPRFEQRSVRAATEATDEALQAIVRPKPDMEVPTAEIRQPEPTSQPVRTPDQAEQIRSRVVENLEKETLEFHMQLKPRDLGRVDVKMVLESGKLAMEIVAASSKSTELLTKQIDGLVASLRLSGVEVSSVNVVTARQDIEGHMDNPYNPESFQNQAGGQDRRGGYSEDGGAGHEAGDYSETQSEEAGTSPQRLLNYSI